MESSANTTSATATEINTARSGVARSTLSAPRCHMGVTMSWASNECHVGVKWVTDASEA